ncbi:MAG: rod shape-determining protein MreC [Alphaproteobacteria bacterium]|nr:rod shape-determining protein MreC [Alphaproteobacteria bacterium]MCY4319362.1 rod shape-determining protein MreC [Alphaproteobacteria bacterium]
MQEHRAGPEVKAETPFQATLRRAMFALLVTISLIALVVGKAEIYVFDWVKSAVGDILAPVLRTVTLPMQAARDVGSNLGRIAALTEENARLREENARLRQWQALARRLDGQNRELRRLLRFDVGEATSMVTARVIADTGGPYARSLLMDAGRRQGVRPDQAVVSGEGLIGRVMSAGLRSARVLLITDRRSHVPVLAGADRIHAILVGNNSARPHLRFLPRNAALTEGEVIVTSGRGGVFPPGVPIGDIGTPTGPDAVVEVMPHVDWTRLEFVRVIDRASPDIAAHAEE